MNASLLPPTLSVAFVRPAASMYPQLPTSSSTHRKLIPTPSNNTACYCDSDSFATQTQDCIFSSVTPYPSLLDQYQPRLTKPRDCAGQDGTFHQWRGSICASSTTTSSSTSAATSTSSSSGSSGLSKGAIAGISVGSAVAGIAIISLIVFTLLRRRWKAANTYNKDSDPRNFPLHKLASASTSVA